jgi:hypothetical protein
VVAFREDGHAVDVRLLESAGEGAGVELAGHIGNVGRGVKIEVDLTLANGDGLGDHAIGED